jgi:hypothetical protein
LLENRFELVSHQVVPLPTLLLDELLRSATEPGVVTLLMTTHERFHQITSGHGKLLPRVRE